MCKPTDLAIRARSYSSSFSCIGPDRVGYVPKSKNKVEVKVVISLPLTLI